MMSTFRNHTMVGKSRRSRTAVGGKETIQKPRVVEGLWEELTGK